MHASGSCSFPCTPQCVLLLSTRAAAPLLLRELSLPSVLHVLPTNSSCGPAQEPRPCLSWSWWDGSCPPLLSTTKAVTLCLFVLPSKYVTFLITPQNKTFLQGFGTSSLVQWWQGMWLMARESGTDGGSARQGPLCPLQQGCDVCGWHCCDPPSLQKCLPQTQLSMDFPGAI